MSFTWTQLIPNVGEHYSHVATLGITTASSITMGMVAKSALANSKEAIIPDGKFSLKSVFEVMTEQIDTLVVMVIGDHGRKFVPFFCSVFFFVLFNNLFGMVPGMVPATENINTTFAFGMFMFLFYNFHGIKENGIVSYLKHFAGPVIFIAPIMFVIEIVSHMIRPLTLGLRLANILRGDHAVLSVFIDIAPYFVPVIFYTLGLLVCLVQAFVFTLLSMVYVALATAHDH